MATPARVGEHDRLTSARARRPAPAQAGAFSCLRSGGASPACRRKRERVAGGRPAGLPTPARNLLNQAQPQGGREDAPRNFFVSKPRFLHFWVNVQTLPLHTGGYTACLSRPPVWHPLSTR